MTKRLNQSPENSPAPVSVMPQHAAFERSTPSRYDSMLPVHVQKVYDVHTSAGWTSILLASQPACCETHVEGLNRQSARPSTDHGRPPVSCRRGRHAVAPRHHAQVGALLPTLLLLLLPDLALDRRVTLRGNRRPRGRLCWEPVHTWRPPQHIHVDDSYRILVCRRS
jgi:hypothetical protein